MAACKLVLNVSIRRWCLPGLYAWAFLCAAFGKEITCPRWVFKIEVKKVPE